MVGAAMCAAHVQPKWSLHDSSQRLCFYGSLSALIRRAGLRGEAARPAADDLQWLAS
jgi:hypothetical protein